MTSEDKPRLRVGITPDGRTAWGVDPESAAARRAEAADKAALEFDEKVGAWCWSRASSLAWHYNPKTVERCVVVFGRGFHPTEAAELAFLWRLAITLDPMLMPGKPADEMTLEELWPLDYAARQLWTSGHGRHRIRAAIFECAARGTSLWAKAAQRELLHPKQTTDHDGYWHDVKPHGWPGRGAMEILCDLLIQTCGGHRPGTRVQVYPHTPTNRYRPADAVVGATGPAGFATSAVWMDNSTSIREPCWYVVDVDGGHLDWTVAASDLAPYPPATTAPKEK